MIASNRHHPPLVPVPLAVQSDILLVRETGLVNMLDAALVAAGLDALGMHETASWIQRNLASYMAAVIFGMASDTSSSG